MIIKCELCGQSPETGNTTRTFFPWPTELSQKIVWRNCLGIEELDLSKSDLFLCSDHLGDLITEGIFSDKNILSSWIFGKDPPESPFDDEELVPGELSMIKILQSFVTATKERPPEIVPFVTPITKEIQPFLNILVERQEKYLAAYCKSCLRQADLINVSEATHEGVSVLLMYKTVFITEVSSSELPEVLCNTCIKLLSQCYKFVSMSVKSSRLLCTAKERFKYLPTLFEDSGDLKNIPYMYSAKLDSQTALVDKIGTVNIIDKKRKSTVKYKDVPEKNRKLADDYDDDNDNFDHELSAGAENYDSDHIIKAEIEHFEDISEDYCVICRVSFTNIVRHMDKLHQMDLVTMSCNRCGLACVTAEKLCKHHMSCHMAYFKCQLCFMQYEDQKGLDRHMRLSSCRPKEKKLPQKTKYICKKCGISDESFKVMFEHAESEHKETLECIFCLETFRNKFCLYCHFKIHARFFYCANHFIAFDTKEELLEHFAIPGHDLECGACSQVFSSKRANYAHRRVHSKRIRKQPKTDETFTCPDCNLVFSYINNLKRHQDAYHKKISKYLCEDCGSTYRTNYQLRTHCAKKHNKDTGLSVEPHQCEVCGKTFDTKTDLRMHKASNHYEFACDYCLEGFERAEILAKHEKNANHKWFICDKCPGKYKNLAKLQMHIRKVHENQEGDRKGMKKNPFRPLLNRPKERRPNKWPKLANGNYLCKICHGEYKTVASLAKHTDLHSGTPKYKCHCGRQFWQKQTLEQHYSVHSDERPYACPMCEKAFKDRSTFYKHRKAVHGWVPRIGKKDKNNKNNENAKDCNKSGKSSQNSKVFRVSRPPGNPQINDDLIRLMFDNVNNEEWLPNTTGLEKFVQE